MQPLFYDGFDRAVAVLDTTAYPSIFSGASDGVAEYGAGGVAGNKVKFTAAATGHKFGYDLPIPNYSVEAEVKIESTAETGAVYLMARWVHATSAHYGLVWGANASTHPHGGMTIAANTVYLIYSSGTGAAALISGVIAVPNITFATGTTYRIRLIVAGTLIQGYINDKLIITGNHATISAPGRFAFGATRKAASAMELTFDNLNVTPFDRFANMQTAYDEAAGVIKLSFPTSGSIGMQQLLCYHLRSGDWTVEDVPTSCLFTLLSDNGQKQIVYGSPSDGKLWLFDSTATRAGVVFTGTWRSNWLKLDSDLKRQSVVQFVSWLVSLTEANALEVTVEVADDPDDPTSQIFTRLIASYGSNDPVHIGQRGNFVRIGISDKGSTSTMRLRAIRAGVLK